MDNITFDILPIDEKTSSLADKILKEDDLEESKKLIQLFNTYQSKKNVIRVLKYNNLLDKVSDQMLARISKCPDEFSNSDLISYLNTAQVAIEKANKSILQVEDTPLIQINQVSVDTKQPELSRESKQKIMEAVQALINKSQAMQEQEVLEAEIIEDKKEGEGDDSI